MLRIRPVLVAFATLALGTGGLVGATGASARADDINLCQYQVAAVASGRYTVQNNEWDSSAPECVTTDGSAEFRVANSSISNPTDGAPGGYPSIFAGCHWGDCTKGGLGAHPLPLADIGPERVTSSWLTTDPSGSAYDVAYDIWINPTPTTSGAPDGTEVMVWINHHGQVQPAGSVVATDVPINGRRYDVWYSPGSGSGSGDGVFFEMIRSRAGVTNLNLGSLIDYAVRHGYTDPSWYLISVEAGFEIWHGGAGLATNDFSVSLMKSAPGRTSPGRK
jgi:hypothetical protein